MVLAHSIVPIIIVFIICEHIINTNISNAFCFHKFWMFGTLRSRRIDKCIVARKKKTHVRIFFRGYFFLLEHFSEPNFIFVCTVTCTIENWINFRDCRTHNNFNEVKVFKLVLFSLFDKNIQ